ncbi:DUF2730 family protein [Vibrio alginolyticus]|uniref:DUF2730 family protein n=1 Tax=Vibrio diabolicus TaxID=50719 RepID=UPI002480597D|nr:DUF2730 family protein [Vibrio diabolicus]EIU6819605.1 DUF2730 family protein [Vibrio parahaemolyticus]
MKPESLELVRTFTPWVMSGITLGWIIVVFVLKKTYAKTEDLIAVRQEMTAMHAKVDALPGHEEVTQLRIELSDAKAEIRELRAELKPVNHLAQLLLENELKERNNGNG